MFYILKYIKHLTLLTTYTMYIALKKFFALLHHRPNSICLNSGLYLLSSIDPFSVGKHGDVFMLEELRWRQNDPSGCFTNAS